MQLYLWCDASMSGFTLPKAVQSPHLVAEDVHFMQDAAMVEELLQYGRPGDGHAGKPIPCQQQCHFMGVRSAAGRNRFYDARQRHPMGLCFSLDFRCPISCIYLQCKDANLSLVALSCILVQRSGHGILQVDECLMYSCHSHANINLCSFPPHKQR